MARWTFAVALCSVAMQAWAGVTLTTDKGGQQSVVAIDGDKVRIESHRANRPMTLLFDAGAQKLVLLDATSKSYRTIDDQTTKPVRDQQARTDAAAGQRAQADARLQAALANLPPERRKMVEEQMHHSAEADKPAPAAAPTVEYQRTGQSKTVAGYACDGYREMQDKKPKAEGCYIPFAKAGVSQEDLHTLQAFFDFARSHFGAGAAADSMSSALAKAPGIPAERTDLDDSGKPGMMEKVVRITKGAVPASQFQVPSDYTEQTSGPPRP